MLSLLRKWWQNVCKFFSKKKEQVEQPEPVVVVEKQPSPARLLLQELIGYVIKINKKVKGRGLAPARIRQEAKTIRRITLMAERLDDRTLTVNDVLSLFTDVTTLMHTISRSAGGVQKEIRQELVNQYTLLFKSFKPYLQGN